MLAGVLASSRISQSEFAVRCQAGCCSQRTSKANDMEQDEWEGTVRQWGGHEEAAISLISLTAAE